jgi:hypothetical protein
MLALLAGVVAGQGGMLHGSMLMLIKSSHYCDWDELHIDRSGHELPLPC